MDNSESPKVIEPTEVIRPNGEKVCVTSKPAVKEDQPSDRKYTSPSAVPGVQWADTQNPAVLQLLKQLGML